MDSESARMSSAAEARYRIDYPNSKPRVIKVVALDAASEHVVKRVAERQWQRATFFTSIKFDGRPRVPTSRFRASVRHAHHGAAALAARQRGGRRGLVMQAWLGDLAGRTKALVDEVASADLVVMGRAPAPARRAPLSSARPAPCAR